ncbi:MAG: TPM domain-containing protein [Bdellovibrionales bacterium]|nr:TPM domain-containing protein [Bdellovibrionales bacterium]
MKFFFPILLAIQLTGLSGHCESLDSVPSFQGDVLDEVGVLTAEQVEDLQLRIQSLRDSGNVWMAVYFAKDVRGTTIEDLAQRVFQKWKLGKKKVNNGLLFIAVPSDRKMRFEVGYGLESVLTDAWTKRLQEETLKSRFRNSEYSEGVSEAIELIAKKVSGKVTGLDDELYLKDRAFDMVFDWYQKIHRKDPLAAWMIVILLLSLFYHLFLVLKKMSLGFVQARLRTKIFIAVILAFLGYLIHQEHYVFLVFFLFFGLFFTGLAHSFSRGRTYRSGGGLRSSWSSSSRSSGSGSSSSGSSSGGGSSGGGGSSSSW